MIRVAIASPILAVRAGLRALLALADNPHAPKASLLEDLQVVYEAASPGDFAADAPAVDVLVLTSEIASSTALRRLVQDQEGRLALLLLINEPQEGFRLAGQGLLHLPLRAWGILPIDSSAEELQAAVQALAQGLLVGTPSLIETTLSAPITARLSDETNDSAVANTLVEPLTERESQVLQLLGRGLANKQIAATLSISENTVKFHISSIYAKLGVASRTEAVRAGVQRGLVTL